MDTSCVAKELKLTFVGDGYVGKTCLLWSYVYKHFPKDYVPTVFEMHAVKTNYNGEQYSLSLYDTAGQEDWETLRIMAYPDTDVIVLCFSITRADSMENVKTKWIPELLKYSPNTPIILCGTQVDLRTANSFISATQNENTSVNYSKSQQVSNPNTICISTREGEELKSRINAYKYIECSALTRQNINEVFDACIAAYVQSQTPVKPSCFNTLFACFGSKISSCAGKKSATTKKYKK